MCVSEKAQNPSEDDSGEDGMDEFQRWEIFFRCAPKKGEETRKESFRKHGIYFQLLFNEVGHHRFYSFYAEALNPFCGGNYQIFHLL